MGRRRFRFVVPALAAVAVSYFVPVIVSDVPVTPIDGANEVIVGAVEPTVKVVGLVALPDGAVTEIVPVVAVPGTVATISVVVDDTTVATTPLNLTVFWAGVALKPVPSIATVVPAGPLSGETSRIAVAVLARRVIEVMLPVAS